MARFDSVTLISPGPGGAVSQPHHLPSFDRKTEPTIPIHKQT